MTEDQLKQVLDIVKQAHGNNVEMLVLLDPADDMKTANMALAIQQALRACLPADHNTIITPGASSMFIRIESPKAVKTYGVTNLQEFDRLVQETHEPIEAANPGYKNQYYLFGAAIELVLNKHYLVYSGSPK